MREYRDGDEQAIFDLAKAVNGDIISKEAWLEQWNWKYRRNPAGKSFTWFAEDGGRLAGQYTVNPVMMEFNGQDVLGAQSVDTMTHPEYRRQKIFETLAKKVYEDAAAAGVALLFGFPNRFSYSGFVEKLGWSDVSAHRALLKPFNVRHMASGFSGNALVRLAGTAGLWTLSNFIYRIGNHPHISGAEIKRISRFDERADYLWQKVKTSYKITVKRDRAYLNWRYAQVPGITYHLYTAEARGELLGYCVFRCEKQSGCLVGRIFDLVAPLDQPQITMLLVNRALEVFREENADFALYRLIAPRELYRALRRSGFFSLPFIGEDVRFITRALSPAIPIQEIGERKNWLVQTGDSDAL